MQQSERHSVYYYTGINFLTYSISEDAILKIFQHVVYNNTAKMTLKFNLRGPNSQNIPPIRQICSC